MKKIEKKILMLIILACLYVLALASVFIWHNMVASILFTAGLFVWLWTLKQNKIIENYEC